MPHSIYIHIPFCNRICPYCDFNKYVVKGQPVMDYLQALKNEMKWTLEQKPPEEIKTIFVGGGTPTILNVDQMGFFLETIHEVVKPRTHIEFSMEANPETVDDEKLSVMKAGGVNRLSFGVQTFDPALLRRLGRMHDPEDVYKAIENAKKVGIDNISIDLMFGLPQQTVRMFMDSLDLSFQLDIPHFSAYSLKVEEGTFFYTLEQKGKLPLPAEEEEVKMYELLMERMNEQGYKQYEISNFARPGYQSEHNLTYWRNDEYYGFGAGAHGYVQGIRHMNAGPLTDYIDHLKASQLPIVEQHHVQRKEMMEEEMIMGLRMINGVSAAHFHDKYGVHLEEQYKDEMLDLTKKGLIERRGDAIKLTKRGILLGNEVFATFLS